MVKIKLLRSVGGIGFDGKPYSFAKGAIVEVEDKLATDLCQSDNADKVIAKKGADKRQTATSKTKKETR